METTVQTPIEQVCQEHLSIGDGIAHFGWALVVIFFIIFMWKTLGS